MEKKVSFIPTSVSIQATHFAYMSPRTTRKNKEGWGQTHWNPAWYDNDNKMLSSKIQKYNKWMNEKSFLIFMELTMNDFMHHVGIYLESATQYSHMSYYSPKPNITLYYDDQRDNVHVG